MAIVKIKDSTETFFANDADTTYIVSKGVEIDADSNGIGLMDVAKNRVLIVDGTITSDFNGIDIDDQFAPIGGTKVIIGKSGVVTGDESGVYAEGQGQTIINSGRITGDEAGVLSDGTNTIVNNGKIHGETYGIQLHEGTGDGLTVVTNRGTISGGEYAIIGSSEYEKVINTGKIIGNVDLGDSDDIFVFKSGSVSGSVAGGFGDDTYYVNKAGLTISEDFAEGIDRVYASVSIEMSANVETLYLTGKKNLEATGGTGGNWIYGNSGANRIDGAGGMDYIDGGRGNDVLTGGSSSDDFHFGRGTGKDVVTDYEAGFDEIQLGDLKGATDYANMIDKHLQQKGDDLWITYGHDVVVLKDTLVADLKASDFYFG